MTIGLTASGGASAYPADIINPLILDFLEWLSATPRSYGEVMEAWKTSCPRLTVWEDAIDAGYAVRRPGAPATVEVTVAGQAFLAAVARPILV